MKITTKTIQGILLSNFMILGLAACSSSPSPWSQESDSPWKSKRDSETTNVPAEEFIAVPMDEPAPIAEPEPMYEPEPAFMPEPEPIPEPAVVGGSNDIMAMPANSYAVQVYAGGTEESVARYQAAHGLVDLWTVKTDRDGSAIYVLVSVQNDRASANQAAADLEQKTGSKPWVRSMAGLQKIVAR